jgi:hypothetical protein
MTEAPGLRDALFLVSKGVPYSQAMGMSPTKRLAMCIVFGEQEGGTWDWDEMRWRKIS